MTEKLCPGINHVHIDHDSRSEQDHVVGRFVQGQGYEMGGETGVTTGGDDLTSRSSLSSSVAPAE